MKAIHALLPASLLLAALVSSNAGAEQPTAAQALTARAVNPAVIANFVNWTWVKGSIKVNPAAATGQLAGLSCNDITVSATSQAQNPVPPGGLFTSPKWVHSVHATGTWSSGVCSYAVTVPPQQNFAVSVGGTAPGASGLKCYLVPISATPAQAGWFKLAVGTTKEQDFTENFVACESPPA